MGSVTILIIIVVKVVVSTASYERPSSAIYECVIPDMVATHLVVQVNCLNGNALHSRAFSVLDVGKQVVANFVAWTHKGSCLLPARVKCTGIAAFKSTFIQVIVFEQASNSICFISSSEEAVMRTIGYFVVGVLV